jgi:hypothetical protein
MNPKRLVFFLLMPIMVPIAVFMNMTFDWWVKLTNRRLLFFLLAPLYVPLALFLNWTFDPWAKLAD